MTSTPDPGTSVAEDELDGLRSAVEAGAPHYLAELEHLVNQDCGSYSRPGVQAVGRWTGNAFSALGGEVEFRADPDGRLGDTVISTWTGGPASGPRVLLIGHLDTVFAEGTAAERPFAVQDGVATGPGVTDMKAGLLAGLHAIRAVRDVVGLPFERLTFIANPDEEIGSPSSTPHIVEVARDADVCLVLECARANGDIVSSRKGILSLELTVHGRAAHAGVEPEKGRSAILEAARLTTDLHAINGRWPDVTVNVGLISGGSRPNVVAERCDLEVDVRAIARDRLELAGKAVREVAAATRVPDTRVDVQLAHRWWPMERLEPSGRLVDHAVALAGRLGFDLADTATGGASDGNTTAGLGVPTLDGLGPIGGNDHSPDEYLEVGSIVPRTTLLAALLLAIARDPVVLSWRSRPRLPG